MYTFSKKVKRVKELEIGDILKRKSTKEYLVINQITTEDENIKTKSYFYHFPLCGRVKDVCMRNFFESTEEGIVVYK